MFVNWEPLILLCELFFSVIAQMFCWEHLIWLGWNIVFFFLYISPFDRYGEPIRHESIFPTLPLSLMDPLPRMDIFTPVSSCNRFMEFPRGPSSFPTKLNCNTGQKDRSGMLSVFPIKAWRRGQMRIKSQTVCGQICLKPSLSVQWRNSTCLETLAGH